MCQVCMNFSRLQLCWLVVFHQRSSRSAAHLVVVGKQEGGRSFCVQHTLVNWQLMSAAAALHGEVL
jgi:hypothetical protein